MNKFVAGVADAYFYDGSGNLVFQGKTDLDNSVNNHCC